MHDLPLPIMNEHRQALSQAKKAMADNEQLMRKIDEMQKAYADRGVQMERMNSTRMADSMDNRGDE